MAPPPLRSDLLQTLDICTVHGLTAKVRLRDKSKILLQPGACFLQRRIQNSLVRSVGDALPPGNFCITPQHLEPCTYLVNTVVTDFQLGRLVHEDRKSVVYG